jgi:tetratricopeptide (TPR) repeat protein
VIGQYHNSLVVALERAGWIAIHQERWLEAMDLFDSSVTAVMSKGYTSKDFGMHFQEIISKSSRGYCLLMRESFVAAHADFLSACVVAQRLADIYPNMQIARSLLVYSYRNVGDCEMLSGRLERAVKEYEVAFRLSESLIAIDREVSTCEQYLECIVRVGVAYSLSGRRQEGERLFKEALRIVSEVQLRAADATARQKRFWDWFKIVLETLCILEFPLSVHRAALDRHYLLWGQLRGLRPSDNRNCWFAAVAFEWLRRTCDPNGPGLFDEVPEQVHRPVWPTEDLFFGKPDAVRVVTVGKLSRKRPKA